MTRRSGAPPQSKIPEREASTQEGLTQIHHPSLYRIARSLNVCRLPFLIVPIQSDLKPKTPGPVATAGYLFVTVVSSSSRDCGNHVTIKRGTAKGTYVGRGPSKTCSCPYHRRASSTLPCLGAMAFRKSDGKWKRSRRQHTWLTLYGVVTPRRTNILAGERDRVAGDRCTAANRPGTHAAGGQTAGNATGATHACRDIDVAARHPDL